MMEAWHLAATRLLFPVVPCCSLLFPVVPSKGSTVVQSHLLLSRPGSAR